ncbi:MAG: 2-hydroxyacyl-CoA dehydratase family protein [Coriobacteriales bacterium]|jgi:benzoyl-CoA reductase/2-hydroxyglutaryl-CoA dehydratase subunit BcrC/BadD/HgdB
MPTPTHQHGAAPGRRPAPPRDAAGDGDPRPRVRTAAPEGGAAGARGAGRRSLGDRVIGWYGGQLDRRIATHPDLVRRGFVLGFAAKRWQARHLPNSRLMPWGRMAERLSLENVTSALEHPDEAVVTSIFLPNEVFHAMGLHPVSAEAISCFVSGTQAESGVIAEAHARGIPETYCSYHKVLVGAALSGVIARMPMLASCSVACDANNLTFRAISQSWGSPHVYVDVPYDQGDDSILYVADQLRALGRTAQDVYGRRLDEDALRQGVGRSIATCERLGTQLARHRGRYLANTMTHELHLALAMHLGLGTPQTLELVETLGRDLDAAPAYAGDSLVWVHTTPYFLQGIGSQVNLSQRAQIACSDMSYDQAILPGEARRFDASAPFEAMAERLVRNPFNGPVERRAGRAAELARLVGADGAVVFCHWGCKSTCGGAQLIRSELERAGVPTLVLDGDGCDRAMCMKGQMETRFSAFLELVDQGGTGRRAATRDGDAGSGGGAR